MIPYLCGQAFVSKCSLRIASVKRAFILFGMGCVATFPAHAGDLLNGWNTQASVTLRGGLEHKNGENAHFVVASPELLFTRSDDDFTASVGVSAEIDQQSTESVAPRKFGLDGNLGYQLSANSGIELGASYRLSQPRPTTPLTPTDVAQEGHAQALDLSGAYTQRLGKSTVQLRGSLSRAQMGNDQLGNGSFVSSAERNYWQTGIGGRFSHAITPRITAFVDAQLARQIYDASSPSLLAKRDNWQSDLRLGLGYAFNEQFSAEASVGVVRQDYDDALLDDLQAYGYNANLKWRPWRTGVFGFTYSTDINPASRTGEVMEITDAAQLTFTQNLNTSWAANSYLSLSRQQYRETGAEVKKSGIGFGVSYQANTELSAFANYGFELTEETAKGPEKVHKIEAGFRFTRK